MQPAKTEPPTVAIVGAGPAGLCLARILQLAKFKAIIFEADESAQFRSQGGSLDLHAGTGQRALKVAQLFSEFLVKVQQGADGMCIMNETGKILYQDAGDGGRPEILREDLKTLLLDSLEEGTVKWGHKLVKVEPPDMGAEKIKLSFTNGTVACADIVVGADGTWSKVRPVLTTTKPDYTGVSLYEIILPLNHDTSFFPKGTLTAMQNTGAGAVVMAHLFGSFGRVYVAKRCQEPLELQQQTPQEMVDDWTPEIKDLVGSAPAIQRDLFALPTGFMWSEEKENWKSRVALIGDAAHVMSPFAGEGANLALADAADLASALVKAFKAGGEYGSAIALFNQKTMWPRAKEAATESANNLEVFFSNGGAEGITAWFKEMMSWRNMFWMIIVKPVLRLLGF
ncbi:UNVERIFIED_CONTAM: hypothetical protein HDU68_002142 [Siphonaria sp. JEL0065]|nr:hypothetical protein HDU68_002142 [Siphonaria sp. JEL0065]